MNRQTLWAIAATFFLAACASSVLPTSTPQATPEPTQTESPDPTAVPTDTASVADEPPIPQAVTFESADGVTLSGTLYGDDTTAVIFSTMGEHHQETWAETAQIVADLGYMALTYDFRFWQADGTIDGDLRDYADDDLLAAVAFARQQGAQQIVLVGASLGGMAVLNVADETGATAVVILSSPLNQTFFPTLHTTEADVQAITAPILLLASAQEEFASDIQRMYDIAAEPKELHLYPGIAHGTELFSTPHAADLTEHIVTFIQTYAPP